MIFVISVFWEFFSNKFEREKAHKVSNYLFNICKIAAIRAWLYSSAPFVLLWWYSNELQVCLYFCYMCSCYLGFKFFVGVLVPFSLTMIVLICLGFSSPEEIGRYPEGNCIVLHLYRCLLLTMNFWTLTSKSIMYPLIGP